MLLMGHEAVSGRDNPGVKENSGEVTVRLNGKAELTAISIPEMSSLRMAIVN